MGLLLKKGGVQKAFSAKTYIIKIGFSEDSATEIPLGSVFEQILLCFNGGIALLHIHWREIHAFAYSTVTHAGSASPFSSRRETEYTTLNCAG